MTDEWRKDRIGAALKGENPTVLRRLTAGFAVIGDVQFLPGYSVLLVDEPGVQRLSGIAADHPRITKAWADTGYRTKVIGHGVRLGIDVEVTRRDPAQKGFQAIPRRWVVERIFDWLMHHRRLARDYETHPHRSEAMIKVAMVDLMSRRLTHESTPNWRDA